MDEKYEEVLERIFTLREGTLSDTISTAELRDFGDISFLLAHLEEEGFVNRDGDQVALTGAGMERAEALVRNHRLAERLLQDLFKLEDPDLEDTACKFEHILSSRVTESVCTFLGHPPVCPHGRKIPPGECCRQGTKKLKPLVRPIQDLEPGTTGKIVFILPEAQVRLSRLSALGILPGASIKLLKKRPSVVLTVDETTIALEMDVAREIFVKEE